VREPVQTGGHAEAALELAREVALIGEPGMGCDRRKSFV
jgi:hypothetical protein